MLNTIQANRGKIDAVYYAPDRSAPINKLRKPEIGMALMAKNDFPEINFQKSIMVGDKITDMTFGKSAGMITVYLSNDYNIPDNADYHITAPLPPKGGKDINTPDNADYHIRAFADLLEVIALAKAQRHNAM
jgi:histidinol phosphatase-like enzyme